MGRADGVFERPHLAGTVHHPVRQQMPLFAPIQLTLHTQSDCPGPCPNAPRRGAVHGFRSCNGQAGCRVQSPEPADV